MTQAGANSLRRRAQEVGVLVHAATAILVREQRDQRGFDLAQGMLVISTASGGSMSNIESKQARKKLSAAIDTVSKAPRN